MARTNNHRTRKSATQPIVSKDTRAMKKTRNASNEKTPIKPRQKVGNPSRTRPRLSVQSSQPASTNVTDTATKVEKSAIKQPPVKGPKLHRFKHHKSKIEWLNRLDQRRDGESESGMQGYVFRARIEGREYALKVFKDFDVESRRYYWEAYLGADRDPREVTYYIDPFYCECRAYGRIRDALVDGTLQENPALPCYGYIILRPEDEKFLSQNGVQLFGEYSDVDSQSSSERPRATRALVKQLAGPASGLTVRRQGKVLRDILILNDLGIYNRDVRADNYRDGLLVDFGSSVTEPDIILQRFDGDELQETILQDGGDFEDMLDEENIRRKVDALATRKTLKKLRNRTKQRRQ